MDEQTACDLTEVEMIKIDRAFDRMKRLNHYEVLNLPQGADKAQIKRMYYAVSKEFHPDRYFRRNLGAYKDKLEAIFDQITRAYNTLGDDTARAAYDRSLIEDQMRARPADYEVSFDFGQKAAAPSGPRMTVLGDENFSRPSAPMNRADAAPGSTTGPRPTQAPQFMSKIQDQVMGRMVRARDCVKAGKEAFEKGNFAAAVSNLQLALSFDPNVPDAKALLEQAQAKAADGKAELHFQRGLQLESLGNHDSARASFKHAVECKPKKGHYYFKLGTLEIDVEAERRQALENLKLAVQYDGKNIEYLLALAKAYETVNMPRNAAREYEKVVSLEKGHDVASRALKRLKAVL